MTIAALGATGLVGWPIAMVLGGGALAIRMLNPRPAPQPADTAPTDISRTGGSDAGALHAGEVVTESRQPQQVHPVATRATRGAVAGREIFACEPRRTTDDYHPGDALPFGGAGGILVGADDQCTR